MALLEINKGTRPRILGKNETDYTYQMNGTELDETDYSYTLTNTGAAIDPSYPDYIKVPDPTGRDGSGAGTGPGNVPPSAYWTTIQKENIELTQPDGNIMREQVVVSGKIHFDNGSEQSVSFDANRDKISDITEVRFVPESTGGTETITVNSNGSSSSKRYYMYLDGVAWAYTSQVGWYTSPFSRYMSVVSGKVYYAGADGFGGFYTKIPTVLKIFDLDMEEVSP